MHEIVLIRLFIFIMAIYCYISINNHSISNHKHITRDWDSFLILCSYISCTLVANLLFRIMGGFTVSGIKLERLEKITSTKENFNLIYSNSKLLCFTKLKTGHFPDLFLKFLNTHHVNVHNYGQQQ